MEKREPAPLPSIDQSWTLFLDRDGVINVHRPNDYVKTWDEFEFLPGSPEALATLSKMFGRIILATNQRGVGRSLMTKETLDIIHARMLHEVRAKGGDIHGMYAATELEEHDTGQRRKPGIGMALDAKEDYPDIDFARSFKVGDGVRDIHFGQALGMRTVLLQKGGVSATDTSLCPDYVFDSLAAFARAVARRNY